jgi:hypothetical protein
MPIAKFLAQVQVSHDQEPSCWAGADCSGARRNLLPNEANRRLQPYRVIEPAPKAAETPPTNQLQRLSLTASPSYASRNIAF